MSLQYSAERAGTAWERANKGSIIKSGLTTPSRDQQEKLQFEVPTEFSLTDTHLRVPQVAWWCYKIKDNDLGWQWFTFYLSSRTVLTLLTDPCFSLFTLESQGPRMTQDRGLEDSWCKHSWIWDNKTSADSQSPPLTNVNSTWQFTNAIYFIHVKYICYLYICYL